MTKQTKNTPQKEKHSTPSAETSWSLMWRKFRKHNIARIALSLLAILYLITLFAQFIAPYSLTERQKAFAFTPPTLPRFYSAETGLRMRPFVFGVKQERNPTTYRLEYTQDREAVYPLRFLVQGSSYRFLGLFETNLHLFGVSDGGVIFLLGADELGRDLFSRTLIGGQVSLSIGLVGVTITIILGSIFGAISGFYGGIIDNIIQRLIEVLMSFPALALWMSLAGALPKAWSGLQVYFAIVCILALINWTGLARQIRGMVLSLRESELVASAQAVGSRDWRILIKHILPQTFSHIVVIATISIPGTILAESALSYLGLGLRPPLTSWGVLLQDAQSIESLSAHPWLVAPAFCIIFAVLLWNFVGDGLRDAADPYSR